MATFQLPSNLPFAAALNPGFAQSSLESFAAIFEEQRVAYASDEFTSTIIAGTTIPWATSTEVQGLISERWASGEQVPGQTLQQVLDANPGPDEPWNWSYADWGLAPSYPAKVQMVTVMDPKTGVVSRQIAVPA